MSSFFHDRNRLAALSIGLAAILFLSVTLLLRNTLPAARLDLTEQGLFTLSDGTRQTLAKLEEPVRVRLYASRGLLEQAPQLSTYAERVRELLGTYAALSNGRLVLEIIDPEPYSPEEDRAVAFGLRGVPLGGGAGRGFFGLAATNSTDDQEIIEFLAPERESYLEYDLTRIVHALASPGKPAVAVIDGLGLNGGPTTGWQPLQVQAQLAPFFEMTTLGGDIDRIDPKTAVLLVIHPQNLSDRTLYAIDQYVLGGGRALVFVDPLLEGQAMPRPGMPPQPTESDLPKLFGAWGVEFSSAQVVGDRRNALEVQTVSDGRPVVARHLAWLAIQQDGLNPNEPAVAALSNLTLTSAGAFSLKDGATATLVPLVSSSADSSPLALDLVAPGADITRMAAGFRPGGKSHILAGRLEGTLNTAFPDGPPQGAPADAKEKHLATSAKPASVVLVGDADLLTDRTWIQVRDLFGQRVGMPFADNAAFAANLLETLAGADALVGLRSRGQSARPFEKVRALQAAADERFRATEQELMAKLREAEDRLAKLSTPEQGDALLTPEQQAEIERFRAEMLETRAKLREVQHALHADIDALETRVVLLNTVAVPLLVALLGAAWLLRRPRRVPPTRESIAA